MREQVRTRLEQLRKEYETGQARLQELERQELYIRETLLRISGAITALEELLQAGETPEESAPAGGQR